MKKNSMLLGIMFSVIASCFGNDSDRFVLLKKKVITSRTKNNLITTDVLTYTYKGKKISGITNGKDYKVTYTYKGKVITKKEEEYGDYKYTYEYTYKNGKLVSSTENSPEFTSPLNSTYKHNSDGTINYVKFRVTNNQQNIELQGKYILKDGNIIKEEKSSPWSGGTSTIIYKYDDKNNPLKNVLGLNLLIGDTALLRNNLINEVEEIEGLNLNELEPGTMTHAYNEKGYPKEKTVTFENEVYKTEYFY